ncbi:MAG: sigma-70 family RNA polymerase sigma factor, partial [Candidatus Subteraquimicrobiales bacterium]|nr:sigma-70 family RNA polymerase sigma factor [Candidatus Subteraquimicrobiales bacterium]
MHEDDKGLVKKAKNGNKEAFGLLYDRYFGKVYGYVYNKIFDQAAAEDVASHAFLRVLETFDNFDERKTSFISWTLCIAHNLVIDYLRKNSKLQAVSVDEVKEVLSYPRDNDPAELVLSETADKELKEAVSRLTDDQQQVIFLKFGLGLSNKEIGQV